MNIAYLRLGYLLALSCILNTAFAINCQRAETPVEYTICNNENLRWLDEILNDIYRTMLVKKDTQHVYQQRIAWLKSRNNCTSDGCIERAYYQGIALLSDVDWKFDWQGNWWNMTATNGSGGNMRIKEVTKWGFHADSSVWSGINRGNYQAEVRKTAGLGIVDNITDANNCKLLLIPLKDSSIEVHSNAGWGCRISMPKDVFIDGHYVEAAKDPRTPPTLLSIGIFTEEHMDKVFHELVGNDYSKFIKAANVYIYSNDLDNMGAKVLSLWVRGMANKHAAIIMYTPEGNIWAAHVEPNRLGKLTANYWSNVSLDKAKMPRTLAVWQQGFVD